MSDKKKETTEVSEVGEKLTAVRVLESVFISGTEEKFFTEKLSKPFAMSKSGDVITITALRMVNGVGQPIDSVCVPTANCIYWKI